MQLTRAHIIGITVTFVLVGSSQALAAKKVTKKLSHRMAASAASTSKHARMLAQNDLESDLDKELESEIDDTSSTTTTTTEPEVPVSSTASSEAAPIGEDVQINDIRYDSKTGGGTVVISTTGAATYRTREVPSQNQVVVEIANAKLPAKLKRPFNTKDFKQPIVSINAYQDSGSSTARIVLQFRQPRSVDVRQNGKNLTIATIGAAAGNTSATNKNAAAAAKEEMNATDEIDNTDVASDDTTEEPADTPSESEDEVEGDTEVVSHQAPARTTSIPPRSSRSRNYGKIMPTSSLQEEREGSIRYFGKPISIEVRDTPVRDVISLIAEQSGANIIISDDVQGTITIKLRQVPWDQALAIIMKTRGLGYIRQSAVLRIAPIRQLQVEADEARKILEAQDATLPLTVRVIPVSFASVVELTAQVRNTLQAPSGPGAPAARGKVEADARSSSLIVTDTEDNVRRIEQLVKALDTPPLQVMIEGKIVEAREESARELGINWGYTGQDLGFAGGTLSHNGRVAPTISASNTTLNLQLGTLDFLGDLDARLSLLEREQQARIISSPRVVTMNAKEAKIEQAVQIAIPTTTTPTSGPSTTSTTYKEIPTALTVTPQITAGGDVIMNIAFKRQFQFGSSGSNAAIESRDIKTNVMVKNGQTTVIGGMYQADQVEQESGTPVLRKIPVLGWLFKAKQSTNTRNELLVFLTPRILNADRNLPRGSTIQ